jgi:uncharacterized protein YdeI (YjbR/CyaY-like superfamily)
MPAKPQQQIKFSTQAAWNEWLGQHHGSSDGVWLQLAKQSSGIASVTYPEAVEVALCHGWIDGQKKGLDEDWWLQKFTPRKADSIWSSVNRQKVLDLIERGLMQSAGRAAIEQARSNGRWDTAYEGQSKAAVPPDLQAALDANPEAAAFFATLKGANRYAILFRLKTAKKPETRANRLRKFVEMLERKETIH